MVETLEVIFCIELPLSVLQARDEIPFVDDAIAVRHQPLSRQLPLFQLPLEHISVLKEDESGFRNKIVLELTHKNRHGDDHGPLAVHTPFSELPLVANPARFDLDVVLQLAFRVRIDDLLVIAWGELLLPEQLLFFQIFFVI